MEDRNNGVAFVITYVNRTKNVTSKIGAVNLRAVLLLMIKVVKTINTML